LLQASRTSGHEMLSEQLQGEVTKKLAQGLHVDFASIGNYLEGLVADVVGNNHTMSEAENIALKVIVEMVAKMQNASIIQHAEDLAEIDRMRDLIQNCSLDASAALRGHVATREQSMITARTSHATCRGEEGVMKDGMELTCSKYDSSRKSSSPPSCLSTDLATDFVQATEVVKRKQMEACLELVQGWLPPLYDKYSTCKLKTEDHENKTYDCNAKQHIFEQSFCSYDSKLEDVCDVQMNCRTSSIPARNKAYEGVKASEAARKADFSAGKRLLCFTDVLRANNTQKTETLQKCHGLSANTSEFDITYHSIPDAAACSKGRDKPCSNGWTTAEYETQAWYNKSKTASCQPCMQPTTTTTMTTTTSTTTTSTTTTTTTITTTTTPAAARTCTYTEYRGYCADNQGRQMNHYYNKCNDPKTKAECEEICSKSKDCNSFWMSTACNGRCHIDIDKGLKIAELDQDSAVWVRGSDPGTAPPVKGIGHHDQCFIKKTGC